jgi:hypothetical protein
MINSNVSLQCVEVTVPYMKLKSTQKEKRIDSESLKRLQRHQSGDILSAKSKAFLFIPEDIERRQFKKQWELLSKMLTSGSAYD